MSEELVKKLREQYQPIQGVRYSNELFQAAADEIERLQTALGKIRRIAGDEIEKQGINANSAVKKLQWIYKVSGEEPT